MAAYQICQRCGRKIFDGDYWTKISIEPEAFYETYKDKPRRKLAIVCQRCDSDMNESNRDEYDKFLYEIFVEDVPDYDKSVRGELDKHDILALLSKLQDRLRLVDCTDTCVVDALTIGGKACLIDNPNHKDCDNCIRNWLRAKSPAWKLR